MRSLADSPVSCFRCYDMKVIDPVVFDSIRDVLVDVCEYIGSHYDTSTTGDTLLERINNHVILLDSMPDE